MKAKQRFLYMLGHSFMVQTIFSEEPPQTCMSEANLQQHHSDHVSIVAWGQTSLPYLGWIWIPVRYPSDSPDEACVCVCVCAAVLLLRCADTVLPSVPASGRCTPDDWDVCWTAVWELLSHSFFLLQSPPPPRFTPPTGSLFLSLLVCFSSFSVISLLQHLCTSVHSLAELVFWFFYPFISFVSAK